MSLEDHKPRLDAAHFVALLLETLLVGVFYVLLIQTFEALRFRARTRCENFFRPMTVCALVLLGTITARWIVDISRIYSALILPDGTYYIQAGKPNPAEIAFSKLSDPHFVASSAMYTSSTVLGDAFMIYRLWVVWGRNKMIIIPPILLLWALATTGAVVAYRFAKYDTMAYATGDDPWIISFYLTTFLCNLYSTVLIALKIFLSGRELRKAQTEPGLDLPVAGIIVESAAVYSCSLIISLATYLAGSDVHFVLLAMLNPMVGVIFCMIVTRSHQAATESSYLSHQRTVGGSVVPMQPLVIKITTHSRMDGENSESDLVNCGSEDRTYPPRCPRPQCCRSSKTFPTLHSPA